MNWYEIKLVFVKEIVEILRDKRTLLLMILVPILSYPLSLMFTLKALENKQRQSESKITRVAVLGPEVLIDQYLIKNKLIQVAHLSEPAARQALFAGAVDVLVLVPATFPDRVTDVAATPEIKLQISGAKDKTLDMERVQQAINSLHDDFLEARLEKIDVNNDWRQNITFLHTNIASSTERTGSWIGWSLPLALVGLVLISTLYPALDLVTGERERGTLSLLLTAAIKRKNIMYGKLLAICSVGLVADVLVIFSLFATLQFFTARLTDASGSFAYNLPLESALLTIPISVPLIVFLSASSICVAAYARNFQQGQGYFVPYLVVAMLLSGACSVMPTQNLPPLIYAFPIANVSVSLRDILQSHYDWLSLSVTFISSVLYAGLFTQFASEWLSSEEALFGVQVAPERRRDFTRTVVVLYAMVFLALYYGGQYAQSRDVIWGMIFTQFVLVLLPAIGTLKWLKSPLVPTMSLKKVSWKALIGGPMMIPGLAILMNLLVMAQNFVLPMPEGFEKMMTDLIIPKDKPIWQILIAVAVSPGICEEALFRGCILGLLRRTVPLTRCAIIVGLMFGVLHMSGYRLMPTAILGWVLCWVVIRTGSIFPAVLMHITNNSFAVLASVYKLDVMSAPYLVLSFIALVLGYVLVFSPRLKRS